LYDEHVKHTLTKKRKLELEDDTAERIELVRKYFARKPK
jgi:sulfur relay (sulfurtransferase) DsrC/TusE family protein